MRSRLTSFSGRGPILVAPLIGLLLYGSRARRDHDAGSDVDLVGVTDGGRPSRLALDHTSVWRSPMADLLHRAAAGDLFVLHLVTEGRAVYERRPVLAELRRAFTYRADYRREIHLATEVGWFLVHHGDALGDPARVNAQMAWCVRTILIARSAERREPVFSPPALAELAGAPAVIDLIANRTRSTALPDVTSTFAGLLTDISPLPPAPARTLTEQRRAFEADRNVVGVSMVRSAIERRLVAAPDQAEVPSHVPR